MLKRCAYPAAALLFTLAFGMAKEPAANPQYQSAFMRVELAAHQPSFVALAVDSLGQKKLSANPLRLPAANATKYEITHAGSKIEYRPVGAPASEPPAWTFEFSTKEIRLTSTYSAQNPPPPLLLDINVNISRATLLGLMNNDGSVRLPALLHWPDQGTFRITSSEGNGLSLGYDALRHNESHRDNDFVKVTFPAASASRPRIGYTLEVVDIYPRVPGIEGDPRFDGFRRDWLNIFQLNPRRGVLANNATSDAVAFTIYEYSAVAVHTPPLAPGLTALDLIRQTVDRYLSGTKGYGLVGYVPNDPTLPYDFLDTYPSLLIAAWDYDRGTNDEAWLNAHYAGIKDWASKLLAMDKDGDGLFEYPESGNSGSWGTEFKKHAANWWDDIGFGNKDAYSNALAYHALLGMAEMARRAGHPEDADLYAARAKKLRSVYYKTFLNPATGVLAGWKSLDGKLHDYYFTFVNGAAIAYGLIPPDKANQIMDHMLAKMKEVGYTQFQYGLPGNLISVPQDDYLEARQLWGGGGKLGFQWYENGGASASFVYFTLKALYQLGRGQEADAILFPMLRSFDEGSFQGKSTYLINDRHRTYDWKRWDGEPCGYEGLLVDGYMTLLAVLTRQWPGRRLPLTQSRRGDMF
ncbi:MAG TPA: hypothetical protein VMV34_03790 [Terriglobia bacterium]|nr:hypothetical protein [Terriglobia bacterium]